MVKKSTGINKKKKFPKITSGVLYMKTSKNNTIISLTDNDGNLILGGWSGSQWFKWSKKSSAYAAEIVTKHVLGTAKNNCWLKEVWVVVRWVWLWRDGVWKAINEVWGIDIKYITEATPLQHGWCLGRRPKRN